MNEQKHVNYILEEITDIWTFKQKALICDNLSSKLRKLN